MSTSKQTKLKPLLESREGVHLTMYLVNRGDLTDLKSQLKTSIDEAYEWLNNAMPIEDRKKFLEPLDILLNDGRIFQQMKGNIGLFRSQNVFRVLNIPIEVERTCQVATSFHVKPLLRWLQFDKEFLFLGLEKNAAHLYQGSQDSFKLIDSFFPRHDKERKSETFSRVNVWLSELAGRSQPKLFMAGEPSLIRIMSRVLKYKNTHQASMSNSFNNRDAIEFCNDIRKILKDESAKALENALLEFRLAEEGNRARKNIFQIAKAVVRGKVRKLIVTDELSIFGKIDPKTGGLAIHPFDLDHEDDCILDDLAQMVLSQGGEVVVAKRSEIPKGRPILAILDDESLEKTRQQQYELLEERFG